jgi:hypothetical protein
LPLGAVRWLVVAVVIYTSLNMLTTAQPAAAETNPNVAELNA